MKAVKFLMPFIVGALYNEGEVAGFEDAVADDLIERKIAEPVKAAKAKTDEPVDPATLDDAALDKLIAAEKVKVVDGADRAAKIEAVLAARKK
ncbi:hypothetical protein [Erythrobacter sp. CCH5-A1]|jgi:hypothetical protein|uniref:hypothetical protein n=1 Tax=Erythrobacter sp. CCH5-A1 TaxID=1768792 RepID=UPI00082DD104|nr:hypothetical protein [Erythrobacter sp. CCH5-A1]